MRVRGEKSGGTREALINAGLDILREQGEAGLSVRAAAKRAGLSPAAAYQINWVGHDTSAAPLQVRRVFLAAIAEAGFDRMQRHMARIPGRGPDHVFAIATAYVRFAQRNPALYRVMFSSELADRSNLTALGHVIAEIYGRFRGALEMATGDTKDVDTRTMALVLLLHGFAMQLIDKWIRTDTTPTSVRRLTRQYVVLFLSKTNS